MKLKNKMVVEFESIDKLYSPEFERKLWNLCGEIDRRVRGVQRGEGNEFSVQTNNFTITIEMDPEQMGGDKS